MHRVRPAKRIVLVRHGETEWSLNGRHTSRTDLALTQDGERAAAALAPMLAVRRFDLVLTSPMRRAARTCELAGLLPAAERCDDLREWDYGDFEGRTTAEIRQSDAEWTIFHDGVPNGETAEDVAARMRRVIDRAEAVEGDVALFGHGHALRVLAAIWLRLAAEDGERFALATGTRSELGYEHESRVIHVWNARPTSKD